VTDRVGASVRLPALALLLAVALSGCPGGGGDGGYVAGDGPGLGGGTDGAGAPGVDGSDDADRDVTHRDGTGDVGMVRA